MSALPGPASTEQPLPQHRQEGSPLPACGQRGLPLLECQQRTEAPCTRSGHHHPPCRGAGRQGCAGRAGARGSGSSREVWVSACTGRQPPGRWPWGRCAGARSKGPVLVEEAVPLCPSVPSGSPGPPQWVPGPAEYDPVGHESQPSRSLRVPRSCPVYPSGSPGYAQWVPVGAWNLPSGSQSLHSIPQWDIRASPVGPQGLSSRPLRVARSCPAYPSGTPETGPARPSTSLRQRQPCRRGAPPHSTRPLALLLADFAARLAAFPSEWLV